MNISEKGMKLIECFEGIYLKAYKCSAGVSTIGIGTTIYPNGKKVNIGDTCTREEAYTYLNNDMKNFQEAVSKKLDVDVNQNQFDALVSIYYNCGSSNMNGSTLMKKLNTGDYIGAANEFHKWCRAGGVKLDGLLRRRVSERDLFLGIDDYIHETTPNDSELEVPSDFKMKEEIVIKYFKKSEFSCEEINMQFLQRLDNARGTAETSFKIVKKNLCGDVGKIEDGLGAIIQANTYEKKEAILNSCLEVGFEIIELNKDYIYVEEVI